MAPIYLNPLPSSSSSPFPLTKDDHHDLDHDHDNFHLFMINSPATHDPRQTHFTDPGHDHDHHNKVKEPISNQDLEVQAQTNHHDHSINGEPARWVSSKVRLVHKMISSSSSSSSGDDHKPSISMMKIKQEDRTPQQQPSTTHSSNHFAKNKNSTVIRVCSDCSTTSTPLWRSGPRGPKSLCNACGIRQRKARRAMAEAQNGTVWSHEPSPVARAQNKSQIKEKKPRTGLAGTIKKQQCKPLPAITGPSISNNVNDNNNQFFKDLALRLRNSSTLQRVFPRDEEEAAFLLMELSCGLVHT